ncbi:MAG: hypothetical protein EBZ96_05655 [Synechococcaceae bacterium WB9_3_282]|nr:hypothetical protein [Synechococcaceae bacterium WB8_3_299]NDD20758.1 hypothetical protein [Synechococcaceae bacterium WBA_3_309]NDE22351.1 hypothetical protein [Synechococcaceae bacterium WB9_3_282]
MPLPHLPGYKPPHQTKLDKRRLLLSVVLFSMMAALLLGFGHRAARMPGTLLQPIPINKFIFVVVGAAFCGLWAEIIRQLALMARSRDASN